MLMINMFIISYKIRICVLDPARVNVVVVNTLENVIMLLPCRSVFDTRGLVQNEVFIRDHSLLFLW